MKLPEKWMNQSCARVNAPYATRKVFGRSVIVQKYCTRATFAYFLYPEVVFDSNIHPIEYVAYLDCR